MQAKAAPREIVVAAQAIEFELAEEQAGNGKVKPDIPQIYFCQDLKGYGWCFRKSNFLKHWPGPRAQFLRDPPHKAVSELSQILRPCAARDPR
jgi:hypothetical protein